MNKQKKKRKIILKYTYCVKLLTCFSLTEKERKQVKLIKKELIKKYEVLNKNEKI